MRGLGGKYLLVLIAMCGMIATSLGILTNTAGLFFSPVMVLVTVVINS